MIRLILLLNAICFFFLSCKKNDINTEEVRLTAIETQFAGGSNRIAIEYNSSGKIVKLTSQSASQPLVTLFNVSYNGNEITMVVPEVINGLARVTDTLRLTTDRNGRVQTKIRVSSQEYFANPQRTYIYDTVLYEYDVAGLLAKELHYNKDSTWFNPSAGLRNSVSRTIGTAIYTNSNGNLTSINEVSDFTATTLDRGNIYLAKTNTVTVTMFEYTKAFKNKTDFSNAAILNELRFLSGAPLNKNYANLPEKTTITSTTKDGSGTIISNQSSTGSWSLSYNDYGFLSGRNNPAVSTEKTTYIYNK